MSRHQLPGAGPPYSFGVVVNGTLDTEMNEAPYLSSEHLHDANGRPIMCDYNLTNHHNQYVHQWSSAPHQQIPCSRHVSAPSMPLSVCSSSNSILSQNSSHDSQPSSFSTISSISDSKGQTISQAEYQLTYDSKIQSPLALSSIKWPISPPPPPPPQKRTAQRQTANGKDFFKTCVSGTKQPRPCNKEQKYFCTACKKPFVEKADWKRHEETYQERSKMFQCDLCDAIYFLDKDFAAHHVHSHRCTTCNENIRCSKKRHVQVARKQRTTRTGWGCGFCRHFSSNWTERCNHIASHIEKEGKTAVDWHHSWVIYSLLSRPIIRVEWEKLLQSKHQQFTNISWNEPSTRRVEGYPESNHLAQLQDQLEYFAVHDDARALAQLAYEKALKQNLPPTPPLEDFPASCVTNPLNDLMELETWIQLMDSVLEDDLLPTSACPLEEERVD